MQITLSDHVAKTENGKERNKKGGKEGEVGNVIIKTNLNFDYIVKFPY